MADQSALVDLLDRAGKVFGLANSLGWEFQQEFRDRPAVNIIFEPQESPRQRHREKINEFLTDVIDLRDAIENPPNGFAPVAEQLRVAGRIAKRLSNENETDILGLFPDLNTVAANGHQSVLTARSMTQGEDPWSVFETTPNSAVSPAFSCLDRFLATPQGHVAFLEFVRDEVHNAADAKRQQIVLCYSNETLASMVGGIKWTEASRRAAELSELPTDAVERVARLLRRELTVGTVEQIDELLGAAVRSLRDAWENCDLSPSAETGEQDFIARLLAGPDDVELTPRELALLKAHLQQRMSLAEMQREARAGTKETATAKNKLRLIRDFNRNLQAASRDRTPDPIGSFSAPELAAMLGGSSNDTWTNANQDAPYAEPTNPLAPAETSAMTEPLPKAVPPTGQKRRGRRKADYETVQREAQLAADWEQARESGVYKPEFAKQLGMTAAKFDALLDRVAKRKVRSEE